MTSLSNSQLPAGLCISNHENQRSLASRESPARPIHEIDKDEFIHWEENPSILGNKSEARIRYMRALADGNKYLNLSHLELTEIPPGLDRLKSVEKINLSGNTLRTLPESFCELSSLTEINLAGNEIDELPEGFHKLSNLTKVNLAANELRVLPESFCELSSLTEIDLAGNEIGKLPKGFHKLSNLTRVNLSVTGLCELSEGFCKLKQLTELNMSGNTLSTLPDSFAGFRELTRLDLSHNQFSLPPSCLKHFVNLVYLNLSNNQLEDLTQDISNLGSLERLLLARNRLRSLPNTLFFLRRLRELDVSDNCQLKEAPKSLDQTPNLKTLRATGTAISASKVDSILKACEKAVDTEPTDKIRSKVNCWKESSGITEEVDLEKFTDHEQGQLFEWFIRLEETSGFSGCDKNKLVNIVYRMLVDLARLYESEFKDDFFKVLEYDLVDCEDHAAMTLNLLHTLWSLADIKGKNVHDILAQLTGHAKTILLRNALADLIAQYNVGKKEPFRESAETYLHYEIKWKKELGLKTIVGSMRYGLTGKRLWVDEKKGELIKKVNDGCIGYMATMDKVKTLWKSNDIKGANVYKLGESLFHSVMSKMEEAGRVSDPGGDESSNYDKEFNAGVDELREIVNKDTGEFDEFKDIAHNFTNSMESINNNVIREINKQVNQSVSEQFYVKKASELRQHTESFQSELVVKWLKKELSPRSL